MAPQINGAAETIIIGLLFRIPEYKCRNIEKLLYLWQLLNYQTDINEIKATKCAKAHNLKLSTCWESPFQSFKDWCGLKIIRPSIVVETYVIIKSLGVAVMVFVRFPTFP